MSVGDGCQLQGLVSRRLGFQPTWTEKRFEEDGWDYEGRCETVACSDCDQLGLDVWRRPYQAGGKTYRYWAVVCNKCKSIVGLEPFEEPAKKALRKWSKALPDVAPGVPPSDVSDGSDVSSSVPLEEEKFEAIVRVLSTPCLDWELDSSIQLHETWELPCWEQLSQHSPDLIRWWTPQAPLESIAQLSPDPANWVDFLIYQPMDPQVRVLEIDGGGHRRAKGVDSARDELLEESSATVERIEGHEALGPSGGLERYVRGLGGTVVSKQGGALSSPPVGWKERWKRPGWNSRYTILGGKLCSGDPLDCLTGDQLHRVHRLTTQVFFAVSTSSASPTEDVKYWATVCRKVLQRGDRPAVSPRTEDMLLKQFSESEKSITDAGFAGRILGPAAVQRLGLAITSAVVAGHLPPGRTWRIDLDDSTGLVEAAAGGILDTLAAIDDVWGTGVVPMEVAVGSTTWRRKGRFEPVAGSESLEPNLRIVLDPFTPPHAELPSHDFPTVVVRSAYLPVRMRWLKEPPLDRRIADPTKSCQEALFALLEDLFGHNEFREGQLATILRLLAGLDTTVMFPTGAGKSLIYQLAGLLSPGMTIVIDPLKSLIEDQSRRLGEQSVDRSAALTRETLSGSNGDALLKGVGSRDYYFVYVTPERLQRKNFRRQLGKARSDSAVNLLVIDEAHCVSEWGHDFRASYLRLGRTLRRYCCGVDDASPPILAMTATASPSVRIDMFREIEFDPDDGEGLQTPTSHDRPNLNFAIFRGQIEDRRERLSNTVFEQFPSDLGLVAEVVVKPQGDQTSSGIVFVPHVNGKFGVLAIREFLRKQVVGRGLGSATQAEEWIRAYSGGRPNEFSGTDNDWEELRRENARRFVNNECTILVATKAYGMGIDKPNIRFTVHYGMPGSMEAFAQESGRAGRDGLPSYCYLIATNPDQEIVDGLLHPADNTFSRRSNYDERQARRPWPSFDIDHQLFFHYNSFDSSSADTISTKNLFDEIWRGANQQTGAIEVGIPRNKWPGGSSRELFAGKREQALVRLSRLGIVCDYTVQYGSPGRFDVLLDNFDVDSIDRAIRDLGSDFEPGRGATLETEIERAPQELGDRVKHHVGLLVDILYRNIEPARVIAIEEMHRLTVRDLTTSQIRIQLGSYLGDGLLTSSLEATIRDLGDRVTPEALSTVFETLGQALEAEREGATSAQLERNPDHPISLLAAAMTQAWDSDGDLERFRRLLRQAFEVLSTWVPEDSEAVKVFKLVLDGVRVSRDGRECLSVDVWEAWPLERRAMLVDVIDDIFFGTEQNYDKSEMLLLLDWQVRRLAIEIQRYSEIRRGVSTR